MLAKKERLQIKLEKENKKKEKNEINSVHKKS
jgi:hypothetical protein